MALTRGAPTSAQQARAVPAASGRDAALVARLRALGRARLAGCVVETLSAGGGGNADVLLVEVEGERVVIKDFSGRPAMLRETWGRLSIRREHRACMQLRGIEQIPRLLGALDAHALVFEYRPGTMLTRSLAGKLPATFVGELEGAIASMHARGVVHLDLRHRSNILADPDGRPVLLDFASALCLDPSREPSRSLLRVLGRIDRGALEKWRVRLETAATR